MGLHSDQSLVTPDPWTRIEAMNVIWCLTDVYFENGATLYIPGSNKWERRGDIPKDAKDRLKPFEAKAGSIVVMDGTVWHTSGANVTKDQDRALLFAYYTAPHLRQQVNWTRKLSPEIKESLSPEMEEWLGVSEHSLDLSITLTPTAARRERQPGRSYRKPQIPRRPVRKGWTGLECGHRGCIREVVA